MRNKNYLGCIRYVSGVVEMRWFASKRKAKKWVYTRPATKAWNMNHADYMTRHYTPVRVWLVDRNNNEIWYKER